MADLKLAGTLDLAGVLVLNPSGGKVTAGGAEVLVESSAPGGPHHGTGAPVILPPPPATPTDPGPRVWVVSSFYKLVTVKKATGSKPVVALGMVMQGDQPIWPGMVMQGPSTVKLNKVPVNVKGDQAVIFPTGSPVGLTVASGQ